MISHKNKIVFLLILSLFFIACSSEPPATAAPSNLSITETVPQPADTPTIPLTTASQTISPSETPEITIEPTPHISMSEAGPWLVIITPEGLWIVNEDGTGLTRLTDRRVAGPQDITVMASPAGGFFAYLTSSEIYKDLTLNIHAIPRGLAQTIPLVAPEYQPPEDALPGDPPLEAVRALVEVTPLSWSPDGTKLAFMGMMDGPSSDLYIWDTSNFYFDPNTTPYTRLTDGPSQGIKPVWSPDGQYIVHAGVNGFGTGAGYSFTGVWAARADDSEVLDLYVPEASGDERLVGWVDETTFLVSTWSPSCGSERLRTFNIETKETESVWETPFNGVAFDPSGGGLLFALDQFTADCSGSQAGLYFLPQGETSPVPLTTEETFLPVWDPRAELFFARTAGSVLGVQPEGTLITLQAPEPILPVGAQGGVLAWASPISGVWVTNLDQPPRQIHTEPSFVPAWSADAQHLFFFSEPGMYVAHAPDFIPQLIGEGLISGGVFWLEGGNTE